MKRYIRVAVIVLCAAMLVSFASCASVTVISHDNGRHEGWFKNPNNPHNPATTKAKTQPVKPEKSVKK